MLKTSPALALMSGDVTDLSGRTFNDIYSLRFKIEIMFKQAIHQIGTFMCRFWLKAMLPRTLFLKTNRLP